MKNCEKLLFSSAIALFFTATGFAQHNLGIATGDYSSINSLYLNPANIAGSHEKVVVNVFSLNIAVDNNFGTFSNLSNIGNSNTNAFNFSGDNKNFSALIPAISAHLPGVMIGLNDKLQQSFALTTGIRAINQLNNFSEDLYTTVKNGDHTSGQNYNYVTQNFNWTAHVWSEIALTYALVLLDNGQHQVKLGITLKDLGGIDYLSLKGKNLDVSYTSGSDSFYASHSDIEFASNAVSANNAYSNGISSSGILSQFFGSKAGSGFGMDIGATYTYTINGSDMYGKVSDNDAEEHKLKASVAVTDIGAIKYKEGNNFVLNVTGNGYMTGSGVSSHLKDYTDLRNYVVTQGYTVDTGNKATKVYMPTALMASADYQIYQRFYADILFLGNLANRQNYGNSYYSQITFTPRYENKLIGVGLPITYSMLAHDVKMGFGFRVSGFFFGSDDVLALFSSNQHGFGFYMGGYVPIYRKKPKENS